MFVWGNCRLQLADLVLLAYLVPRSLPSFEPPAQNACWREAQMLENHV
jgi:hypothetical protein